MDVHYGTGSVRENDIIGKNLSWRVETATFLTIKLFFRITIPKIINNINILEYKIDFCLYPKALIACIARFYSKVFCSCYLWLVFLKKCFTESLFTHGLSRHPRRNWLGKQKQIVQKYELVRSQELFQIQFFCSSRFISFDLILTTWIRSV